MLLMGSLGCSIGVCVLGRGEGGGLWCLENGWGGECLLGFSG